MNATLTPPVEKHPAYLVIKNMARNDEYLSGASVLTPRVSFFSTRYHPENLLRPVDRKAERVLKQYGLIEGGAFVYELTRKGNVAAYAAMVWGDFGAWQAPK
mgnify:CR=1 FL=1